jgi:hypothetical protein
MINVAHFTNPAVGDRAIVLTTDADGNPIVCVPEIDNRQLNAVEIKKLDDAGAIAWENASYREKIFNFFSIPLVEESPLDEAVDSILSGALPTPAEAPKANHGLGGLPPEALEKSPAGVGGPDTEALGKYYNEITDEIATTALVAKPIPSNPADSTKKIPLILVGGCLIAVVAFITFLGFLKI